MTLTSFVFANQAWYECDLIQCTLANGVVIRATNHSVDIVGPDGFTYFSSLYGKWERGGISFERNALTECDVTVTADTTVMFPGTTTPMLWVSKLFARASITITTCTLDITAPTTIVGSVVMFVGRCTAPSMTSTQATLHCADETYLLSEPWPRRVICAGCPWTLFDAQCTLNRNSFAVSCAIGAGSTQTNLVLCSTQNLLPWSEQIDNAAWAKATTGATAAPVVTANVGLDPAGFLTAEQITFASSDSTSNLTVSEAITIPVPGAGTFYCFSIWLRADSPVTTNLLMYMRKGGPFGVSLNTQTSSTNAPIVGTGAVMAITTQWQQFFFAGDAGVDTQTILTATLRLTTSQTGLTIQASRAMINTGTTPATYVPTTTAAAPTTLTLGSVGTDTLPYSKGYIVPTSGQAVGWPIMVTLQNDATHLNVQPFPLPLAVGDAFTLYPGCDGQKATCEFKYANKQNFGGFPATPGPTGAISATGS